MATKSAKDSAQTRVRKLDYKSKKKAVRTNEPVAGGLKIAKQSILHIVRHKQLFGLLIVVYFALFMLLVKGLAANFDVTATRQAIEDATGASGSNLDTGAALLGALISTANSAQNEAASVYQTVLFIIMSLAVIWALRQTFESTKRPRLSDVFYNSTSQLVAYVLTWLVVFLQLLPALFGALLYSIVIANGIAVGTVEQVLWFVVLLCTIGLSLYLISSSLFATYIVTLPGMRPLQSLKKAKALVKFRRFLIIRRLLVMGLLIMLVMIGLFLPIVLYVPVIAELLFVVFSLKAILFMHTYLYSLYREML